MRYAVVLEKSSNGWGAYPIDLPGVGVVGDTPEQALARIDEAIGIHLEVLERVGGFIPDPPRRALWETPALENVSGIVPPEIAWTAAPGIQVFAETTASVQVMTNVPQAFAIPTRDYAEPRLGGRLLTRPA